MELFCKLSWLRNSTKIQTQYSIKRRSYFMVGMSRPDFECFCLGAEMTHVIFEKPLLKKQNLWRKSWQRFVGRLFFLWRRHPGTKTNMRPKCFLQAGQLEVKTDSCEISDCWSIWVVHLTVEWVRSSAVSASRCPSQHVVACRCLRLHRKLS